MYIVHICIKYVSIPGSVNFVTNSFVLVFVTVLYFCYWSVCLSIYLFSPSSLFIYLSIYLSIYLLCADLTETRSPLALSTSKICLSMSVFLSIYQSIYPSIYLSIFHVQICPRHGAPWPSPPARSVSLSVYLSFYLSIYLSSMCRSDRDAEPPGPLRQQDRADHAGDRVR